MKLLKKGAEADLYQTKWQNSHAILKIRKIKKYVRERTYTTPGPPKILRNG